MSGITWQGYATETIEYYVRVKGLSVMECWKDLTSVIQAILTSAAIVVGAFWTYFLFVRERLSFPKIRIELIVKDIVLHVGSRIVHAEIKIINIGHVIFKSRYAELRLRKIVPIHNEIKEDVEKGLDPVSKDRTEIEWPLVAGRKWKWDKKEFEIEPGEVDSLHADYIIDSNIEVAEFYYYIQNSKKRPQDIGWTLTKIHEFNNKGGP